VIAGRVKLFRILICELDRHTVSSSFLELRNESSGWLVLCFKVISNI